MKKKFPPVRSFIHKTLKDFPWSNPEQQNVFAAFSDLLLAERDTSFNSYYRRGKDEITVRRFCYALLTNEIQTRKFINHHSSQFNNIDKRCAHSIAVDDTSCRRYGKKVFGATLHHNHAKNGYEYGNVIVDFSTTSKNYYSCDYKTYLSKKWLKKENVPESALQTKIKLADEIFKKQITLLKQKGVPNNRIWCTSDSWFGCEKLADLIKEEEVNFILGIKKNQVCSLFGKEKNLEKIFSSNPSWKYLKSPYSKKRIYYQQKILNLNKLGRVLVLAIKRGEEKRIRYYASNRHNLTIQTFCTKWQHHWNVETLHDNLKNSFSLNGCYSGREIINLSYWNFVYALNHLFQIFKIQMAQKGLQYTIQQLVEAYCFDYDKEKSKQCFSTPSRIEYSKMRLLRGWC